MATRVCDKMRPYATTICASTADLERSPERLKEARGERVPIYYGMQTSFVSALVNIAQRFVTDDVWLEDMYIHCREAQGSGRLNRAYGLRGVPICVCAQNTDGSLGEPQLTHADRFSMDEVLKVRNDYVGPGALRIFACRENWEIINDDGVVQCFLRVSTPCEEFIELRSRGLIEVWDTENARSD